MGKRRISGSSRVKRATIVLYLGLLLLVACYALMVTTFINRWETRGQFGDSFGALNTIFSGITLVTVVVTLYYQNKANKEEKV
ncbi:MAG: hypothetical protein C6W59_06395 [Paenibacillaceae bacterium]|nr:MAG: hypothetical protein C6W59_06395 [Paenibacillaceae bacterium]